MRRPATRFDDRLAALTALRIGLGVIAVALAVATDTGVTDVAAATLAYVPVVAGGEALRRWQRSAATRTTPALIGLDVVYVVVAVTAAGGPKGPLEITPAILVVAVILLVSARAGIGCALWCSLLLASERASVDTGWLTLPRHGTDDDVAVVAASLVLLAVAVAAGAAMSERGLRRGGVRLAALVDLDVEIERADRDDDVVDALARHATEALGFRRAAVARRAGGSWRGACRDERGTRPFETEQPLGPDAEDVLRTGESALVRTLAPGPLAELLPDAANVVITSLVADGAPVGICATEWGGRVRERIPAATVRALDEAAVHTGLALRQRAIVGEITHLATRDALTGLANRRLLEETLGLELGRAQREGASLSLVIVDVDHFKNVNDTHGHLAGDAVLREVGAALVTNTKAYDLVARYGGDEFVVLLPRCARADVLMVTDELRHAIADGVVTAPVTVSAGAATVPDDATDGEQLVRAADAALLMAKRAGRDRAAVPDASHGESARSAC